jgi:triosephosphate isomerase
MKSLSKIDQSMRKTLIVANWKMHLNPHQASLFMHKLSEKVPTYRDVEVVLCPSFLALQTLGLQVNHRQFKLGAQNCYWRDEGAFTGEVSATMLRGMVDYVIVGHSERRHIFNEHDKDTRHKVQAVLRNGMKPILCIGETAGERADGETVHVLHDQLVSGLLNVTSEEVADLTVAYEPVWAISSGNDFKDHRVPSGEEVKQVVSEIRKQIKALYGAAAAEGVRVLYGGSSNAANANDYLKVPGVDGLLVGGDSLLTNDFASIVTTAHNISKGQLT